MNRFQQIATFRKSATPFGVGDRVVVDGKPATVVLIYSRGEFPAYAEIVEDGGDEWCVPVASMSRVEARG
jgi:hypothetical protein